MKTLIFFYSIVFLWKEDSLERILPMEQWKVVTEQKMGCAT